MVVKTADGGASCGGGRRPVALPLEYAKGTNKPLLGGAASAQSEVFAPKQGWVALNRRSMALRHLYHTAPAPG
jgi:hypothetical protein